jgi:hypothetical protein
MEIFNIDLVAILIFIMPGYYFIAFSGLDFRQGFPLAVNSLFFGILLTFVRGIGVSHLRNTQNVV